MGSGSVIISSSSSGSGSGQPSVGSVVPSVSPLPSSLPSPPIVSAPESSLQFSSFAKHSVEVSFVSSSFSSSFSSSIIGLSGYISGTMFSGLNGSTHPGG